MGDYLYNGIELPDINEVWTDKETYPYAYIGVFLSDTYLYLSKTIRKVTDTNGKTTMIPTNTRDLLIFHPVTGGWVQDVDAQHMVVNILWGSTDVYYYDYMDVETLSGTLYLAASDPVPVDPPAVAPEVEPKAFMAGLRMGQIVRAML